VAFYPHKKRGSKRLPQTFLPQNTSQYICGGLSAPQMTHFKKKIKNMAFVRVESRHKMNSFSKKIV
jgi:hypothetical protein